MEYRADGAMDAGKNKLTGEFSKRPVAYDDNNSTVNAETGIIVLSIIAITTSIAFSPTICCLHVTTS